MVDSAGGESTTTIARTTTITALVALLLFFACILAIIAFNFFKLVWDVHGIRHRCMGLFHFIWLILGALHVLWYSSDNQSATSDTIIYSNKYAMECLGYDVLLGVSGILTTLTAAADFPHKYVSKRNAPGQSGTLSPHAMVTHAEMIEHSFYQFINLVQALYLHCTSQLALSLPFRLLAVWIATSPWYARSLFPVHSFSQNWKHHGDERQTHGSFEWMYKIKKVQYIFYKHVILHGIHIAQATYRSNPRGIGDSDSYSSSTIVLHHSWRLFWILLNTSYVMEFFLNSLVRRHFLSQSSMLLLNRWLMFWASAMAVQVLLRCRVSILVCVGSAALNFVRRHCDVQNTMVMTVISMILYHYNVLL